MDLKYWLFFIWIFMGFFCMGSDMQKAENRSEKNKSENWNMFGAFFVCMIFWWVIFPMMLGVKFTGTDLT